MSIAVGVESSAILACDRLCGCGWCGPFLGEHWPFLGAESVREATKAGKLRGVQAVIQLPHADKADPHFLINFANFP
jgi:hypothetical protein